MVHLKHRKNKAGTTSLTLEYTLNGERHREATGLILRPAKTADDKAHNINVLAIAAVMRADRELEIAKGQTSIGSWKHHEDFREYFTQRVILYRNEDYRKHTATRDHFNKFLKLRGIADLAGKDVTIVLCEDFASYLKQCGLKGETPSMYFKIFRSYLKAAFKDKIVTFHPDDIEVKFKIDKQIRKVILTPDEVKQLYAAETNAPETKRAFFFCLNTGIDYKTVSTLVWNNIVNCELIFNRSKTDEYVRIPLNKTALSLLGPQGKPKELLFTLPSWEACTKAIQLMAKTVGLNKVPTWHTARHTFGTNAINEYGIPVEVLQSLLGHRDIKSTMRYVTVNNKTKSEAVNRMPEY
jgi:integrase